MNRKESESLHGLDDFHYKLYSHAIRRRMCYKTGVVGISFKLSYYSMMNDMYVTPRSGVKKEHTGYPTKSKIERALSTLISCGLIVPLQKGALIFELPLATRDYSIQKTTTQAGTRPERGFDTQAGTKQIQEKLKLSAYNDSVFHQAGTQAEKAKLPQAGTYNPISDNNILFKGGKNCGKLEFGKTFSEYKSKLFDESLPRKGLMHIGKMIGDLESDSVRPR
jgi:hypothetical protein